MKALQEEKKRGRSLTLRREPKHELSLSAEKLFLLCT